MAALPLSGAQIRIESEGYAADIASVGASLRRLTKDGRDLVVPFDADEVRPGYRGVILAPWPNRVVDAVYAFAGRVERLAITEVERGHALHGLLVWQDYEIIELDADRVLLGATVQPQTGYPFRVDVEVDYRVDADGLHTSVRGTNAASAPAPWGTGPHPYLVAGPGRVDDWTLSLPAGSVLEVTPDRLVPTSVASVDGTPFDFRSARPIGRTEIDHAFTALDRDPSGTARVEVRTGNGSGVAMLWDTACPWVQIHTADRPEPELDRIGLAVEPMTCPPDAFNSGTDLVVLGAGESHRAGWTITAL